MGSPVAAIGLLNLDIVCGFVMDELMDVENRVLIHYANLPVNLTAKSSVEKWRKTEETRIRNYVYLATSMVQSNTSEVPRPDPVVASISKPNELPSSLASLFQATDQPSQAPPPPAAPHFSTVSVSRCTLREDLFETACSIFPGKVFHHLFYACSLGMDVSVETMMCSVILFNRMMHKYRDVVISREFLVPFRKNCSAQNSQNLPRLPENYYFRAPKRHNRAHVEDDKYGTMKMWRNLEAAVKQAVEQSSQQGSRTPICPSAATGCGCISRLSATDLDWLLWCVFENIIGCVVGCMCLGVKANEDTLWANRCWAKVSGFSVQEINIIEASLLKSLNFTLQVHIQEYRSTLVRYCSRTVLKSEDQSAAKSQQPQQSVEQPTRSGASASMPIPPTITNAVFTAPFGRAPQVAPASNSFLSSLSSSSLQSATKPIDPKSTNLVEPAPTVSTYHSDGSGALRPSSSVPTFTETPIASTSNSLYSSELSKSQPSLAALASSNSASSASLSSLAKPVSSRPSVPAAFQKLGLSSPSNGQAQLSSPRNKSLICFERFLSLNRSGSVSSFSSTSSCEREADQQLVDDSVPRAPKKILQTPAGLVSRLKWW